MYLSDGYPQATAMTPGGTSTAGVYLSDGYPQATANGDERWCLMEAQVCPGASVSTLLPHRFIQPPRHMGANTVKKVGSRIDRIEPAAWGARGVSHRVSP